MGVGMSDRFATGDGDRGPHGSSGAQRPPGGRSQQTPASGPHTGAPPPHPAAGGTAWQQGPPQPPGSPPQGPGSTGGPGRRPERRPALWVAGGIVVVVAIGAALFFAIRAGGADIQTSDGAVINADEFLDDVRADWRSQLPTENVNIGDDPSCYYVVDNDSDEVTGVIACGGVRRLNAGDGEVWDTYTYEISQNSEGEQVASNPVQGDTAVERPGGALLTAAGDEASDGVDDLAAPELPSADEGILRSGDQIDTSTLELEDVKRPEDAGTVITPGGTVTVESVASAPYLPGEPAEQPAEGEVFRVLTYSLENAEDTEGNVAMSLLIDAAGQQRDVGVDDPYADEQTFVVSVPEGEPASLVVASAGHEQRVDLDTGERRPDPITDAYYRSVTEQDIGKTKNYPFQSAPTDNGPKRLAYSLDMESARITPYTTIGGLGYAKKGKVWLEVTFTGELRDPEYEFNLERTDFNWTATVKGKKVAATKVRPSEWDQDSAALFEVPADVTNVEIAAKPAAVVTTFERPRRTVQFGPTTVKVNFPK